MGVVIGETAEIGDDVHALPGRHAGRHVSSSRASATRPSATASSSAPGAAGARARSGRRRCPHRLQRGGDARTCRRRDHGRHPGAAGRAQAVLTDRQFCFAAYGTAPGQTVDPVSRALDRLDDQVERVRRSGSADARGERDRRDARARQPPRWGDGRPQQAYLDHDATRPVRPEASPPWPRRMARPAIRPRCMRPAATRGAMLEQARARWRRLAGAGRTGWCSPAAAPRPTTWPCRRGGGAAWSRRSSTIRCWRPPRRRSRSCRWTRRAGSTSPAGAAAGRVRPRLVSVMLANNETGVMQPVAEAARLAHAARRAAACRRGPGGGPRAGRHGGPGRRSDDVVGAQARRAAGHGRAGAGARASSPGRVSAAAGRRRGGAAAPRTCRPSSAWPRALDDWRRTRHRRARLRVSRSREAQPGRPRRIVGAGAARLPNTVCLLTPRLGNAMPADRAGPGRHRRQRRGGLLVGQGRSLARAGGHGAARGAARCAIRVSLGWPSTADDVDRFVEAWALLVRRRSWRAARPCTRAIARHTVGPWGRSATRRCTPLDHPRGSRPRGPEPGVPGGSRRGPAAGVQPRLLGLQLSAGLAHEIEPGAEVVEIGGVRLVIEPKALIYVIGTEVDFVEDKLGAAVRVQQSQREGALRLRRELLRLSSQCRQVTFRLPDGTGGPAMSRPACTLLEVRPAPSIAIEGACGGAMACATCHVACRRGLVRPAADRPRPRRRTCSTSPRLAADLAARLPDRHGRCAGRAGGEACRPAPRNCWAEHAGRRRHVGRRRQLGRGRAAGTRPGYDVVGVTLQLYDHGAATGRKGACCAGQDIHDARARRRPAGHRALRAGLRGALPRRGDRRFRRQLCRAGETPIPCVRCNQRIKFARPAGDGARPRRRGAGHRPLCAARRRAATGAELHRAADAARDQSYFLFATTRRAARLAALPAGRRCRQGRDPRATRAAWARRSPTSPTARTSASCPTGRYAASWRGCGPEPLEPGEIVDATGRVLGRHDGIASSPSASGAAWGRRRRAALRDRHRPRARAASRSAPAPGRAAARRELGRVNWLGRGPPADAAGRGQAPLHTSRRRRRRSSRPRRPGGWRFREPAGRHRPRPGLRRLRRHARGRRRLDRRAPLLGQDLGARLALDSPAPDPETTAPPRAEVAE